MKISEKVKFLLRFWVFKGQKFGLEDNTSAKINFLVTIWFIRSKLLSFSAPKISEKVNFFVKILVYKVKIVTKYKKKTILGLKC